MAGSYFFQKRLDAFREAAQTIYSLFTGDKLEKAVSHSLSLIQEGRDIVRFLKKNRIPVVLSRKDISSFCHHYYYINENSLVKCRLLRLELASENPDKIFSSAFHEGRHARQALAGALVPSKNISPKDYLWHNHITEADAETHAVFAAFKMKLAGHPLPFDFKKTKGWAAAMCKAAEDQYIKDPASIDKPEFKRIIFDAWFSIDAVEQCYTNQAISGWSLFSQFATENNLPRAEITLEEVEKIGLCGGENVNYLSLAGFRRLDDPSYRYAGGLMQGIELEKMTQQWQGPKKYSSLLQFSNMP